MFWMWFITKPLLMIIPTMLGFFIFRSIYINKTKKMNMKKIIMEDISNIKFLMGYKSGKVISEQDSFDDISKLQSDYDSMVSDTEERISNSKSEYGSDKWADEVEKEWNEPNFKNKREYLNQQLVDKSKFDSEQNDKLSDERHKKLVHNRPQDFDIESSRQEYTNIGNKMKKIESKLLQIDDMEERLNSPLMKTWSGLNSKRNELFFALGRDL